MRKYLPLSSLFSLLFSLSSAFSQPDTTRHGWPVAPFFSSHPITGAFCEFRNTLTSDHFHNGVDVPMPDGSPVYSVYNGTITAIGTTASQGDNAYVRVRYTVSGLNKSDAYVHIFPNPLLRVGDQVTAYATVLGTILPGLGHVHFTHGLSGAEMNAIRPDGGFTPYNDIYPPKIISVNFLVDGSDTEFPGNRVSGAVDIRAHIQETNAGSPGDLYSSTTNNGTYVAGYKILSADRTSVAYEPPSGGVRYRFDRKPNDADVHNVFATGSDLSTHIYTLTNGNGADVVNATKSVPNSAWNTNAMPTGTYTVMIFAQDTRGLADTEYVQVQVTREDFVAPAPPTLRAVLNDSTDRITVSWYPNAEPDLRGYRLSFSLDGTTWTVKDNEAKLVRDFTSISYDNIRTGRIFFRLAAVDSASPPNISGFSDVYGVRLNSSQAKTLIVDGFDRIEGSGSYHQPSHPFAMTHGFALPTDFSTCANEALTGGAISLNNFAFVVWILGDESTADETFNDQEQLLVQSYLKNGGKLFVSGSEIGYDLDRTSGPTASDREFLHTFLKASYVADNAGDYAVIGAAATLFEGIALRYGDVYAGSPYEEDWPDVLATVGGSSSLLHYGLSGTVGIAGVGFKGVFSGGTLPGAVVTLGFPFETIIDRGMRDSLMNRVFSYFQTTTGVSENTTDLPVPLKTQLFQNFPNPFNPTTSIRLELFQEGFVSLGVFDLLGREVATLANREMSAGVHTFVWNAVDAASGVYYCKVEAGAYHAVKTMVVLK